MFRRISKQKVVPPPREVSDVFEWPMQVIHTDDGSVETIVDETVFLQSVEEYEADEEDRLIFDAQGRRLMIHASMEAGTIKGTADLSAPDFETTRRYHVAHEIPICGADRWYRIQGRSLKLITPRSPRMLFKMLVFSAVPAITMYVQIWNGEGPHLTKFMTFLFVYFALASPVLAIWWIWFNVRPIEYVRYTLPSGAFMRHCAACALSQAGYLSSLCLYRTPQRSLIVGLVFGIMACAIIPKRHRHMKTLSEE